MRLLMAVCGDVRVIVKARARVETTVKGEATESFTYLDSHEAQQASASATPIIATEGGLRFEIGTDPAHDFGIYLDAAKARLHVRACARGANVLNLFSYTAAFAVAAAAGGAAAVTNVDPNREYLAWGLRNAALNDVGFRVLPDTAQDFLRKHLRRLDRTPTTPAFDLVIVDPPAFGVGRGPERLLRLLWPEIFAALRTMLPARIVLCCNDKYFRARRSFVDLVQAELGAQFEFTRLGTCLSVAEVASGRTPSLAYAPSPLLTPPRGGSGDVEDPYYVEPVVMAGTRRSAKPTTGP